MCLFVCEGQRESAKSNQRLETHQSSEKGKKPIPDTFACRAEHGGRHKLTRSMSTASSVIHRLPPPLPRSSCGVKILSRIEYPIGSYSGGVAWCVWVCDRMMMGDGDESTTHFSCPRDADAICTACSDQKKKINCRLSMFFKMINNFGTFSCFIAR